MKYDKEKDEYDLIDSRALGNKGIYRTIKAISSYIKHKISLKFFVHAYTKEGLRLAGCSELDILKYNENKDIKQIETDHYNKVFVLLNNGKLYRNGELIDAKVSQIYMVDDMHLYKITEENKIIPIYEDDLWDKADKYLNNDNCSYKKIITNSLHIVAITEDGDVREIPK